MFELLKIYDDSILYINIDEIIFKDEDCEKYISKIIKDEELSKKVDIGILTYKRNENLTKKYLFDIGIKCGYIELNLKLANTIDIILKTLEANEAKGRRKYIRVKCSNNAKFNIEIGDTKSTFIKYYINGIIHDISSYGFSCKITDDKFKDILREQLKLNNIQLNLRGYLCIVAGEIIIKREEMYIIKFDPLINPLIKNKIYQFIYNELQINIKKEIKIIQDNLKK